jgi:hypothetical protein
MAGMAMMQVTATGQSRWSEVSRRTGLFQIALTAMVAMMLGLSGADSLASWYFFDHDAYLLAAGSVVLIGMSAMSLSGRSVPVPSYARLMLVCAVAGIVAYAGSFLIFHHYAVSRDEQLADFGAGYFAEGRIGWPIPASLHDLGRAMMPLYTNVRPDHLTSDYLPINSAIRALFVRVGDAWLAGPVLLVTGLIALWSCARRIWPEQPQAATIALMMAATSTQILINAATPFAMTGHFALNALWLACVLRGGRLGHALAIGIGVLASGLHQAHFHIVFVLAFVVWMLAERRYRLALAYIAACLSYWLIWRFAYPAVLNGQFGIPIDFRTAPLHQHLAGELARLAQMQPGESLTRFLAWQNLLMLPLAVAGAAGVRHLRGRERILIGCAIACLAGLITPILQDHGYGYRYLHPLLPCFCLLAAGGWIALERQIGRALPGKFLAISIAFAALVTFPVAVWRIMVPAAPYEAAYRAASTADADYVLVDTRAGAYLQDIIRIDPTRQRPVLLDLGYVPAAALDRICAHSRTMLFGERQARAFGIPVDHYRVANHAEARVRAAQLKMLGCYHPMPVG